MDAFLFIGSILAFVAGVGIFSWAPSSVQEIAALQFFLISSVLFVGGAMVRELRSLGDAVEE